MTLNFGEMQAIILNKELAAKIKEQEKEAKRREKEALKQIKKLQQWRKIKTSK